MFSAEYQVDTIKEYFPIFDKYRKKFFVGEMIWNFADFATKQGMFFLSFSHSNFNTIRCKHKSDLREKDQGKTAQRNQLEIINNICQYFVLHSGLRQG